MQSISRQAKLDAEPCAPRVPRTTLKLDPSITAARRAARLAQIPAAPTVPVAAPVLATEPAKTLRTYPVLLKLARACHPVVFNAAEPKPLRIGVRDDLRVSCGFSHREVKVLLGKWCHESRYLATLVTGATRFGLDGVADGEVTEKQVAVAVAELAKRGER